MTKQTDLAMSATDRPALTLQKLLLSECVLTEGVRTLSLSLDEHIPMDDYEASVVSMLEALKKCASFDHHVGDMPLD